MSGSILRGPRVTLRPIAAGDRQRLRAILAEAEVARWWAQSGVDAAVDDLYGDWPHEGWVIEVDRTESPRRSAPEGTGKDGAAAEQPERVIGYIQVSEETDPDYRHASIDLFITKDSQGQGYGSEAIRALVGHLFRDRGHHRVTIDPAVANVRAVHVYRKVGFQPVGVMRRYERGPDGEWHDALLMDLLAEDVPS